MNSLQSIARVNPLLILSAFALAYCVVVFVRTQFRLLMTLAVAAVAVSILALPGGQGLLKRADTLHTAFDKGACLAVSLSHEVPWHSADAVNSVAACRYKGDAPGSGDNTAGDAEQAPVTHQLLRLYGG